MNNDLISRSALLEIIGSMSTAWEYGQAVIDIHKIIKKQPVVDAAPVVHGRWVEDGQFLICPACKSSYDKEVLWYYTDASGKTDGFERFEGFERCPHCGAKLDGGDDDG